MIKMQPMLFVLFLCILLNYLIKPYQAFLGTIKKTDEKKV